MSTQPLAQAVATSRDVLAAVAPDQLSAETPCASWDVAALINHIVGAQHFFLAAVTGSGPGGEMPDFATGDYLAAFDEASAACLAAFGADGLMAQTLKTPMGDFPAPAFMGLAVTDTLAHAWDLAKATGQNTDLAPELSAGVLAQAQASIPDTYRGPEGAPFGMATEAPEGASNADRLAAFLGRTV